MRRIALIALTAFAGCDRAENMAVSQPDPKPQQKQEPHDEVKAAVTATAPAVRAQLPVTSVTLYGAGVAHVEHKGTVLGDANLELQFKGSEVPNVLKSLLVDDPTSAQQAIVRPDDAGAADSASQRRVNLSDNPTRADLLKQLRGARVRIDAGDEPREMTILSVEEMPRPERFDKTGKSDKNGDYTLLTWQVNAISGTTLHHIPFDQIKRIELIDTRAQQDLSGALDALWQKESDNRTVSVQLRGQGERPVRIGYTMEAAPWKISYRLALSDKPVLQAWASVANATDTDWNGIRLNLMGGRPLVLGETGTADASAVKRATRDGNGVPAGESFRRPRPVPSRESLDGEAQAIAASGREEIARMPDGPVISARESFRFPVPNATIPRQSTAMVPILNGEVTVEPVAVYNESMLKRNALQGARIRNTSRHYLLSGTVTVLDEGSYVGDASLENLAPGRFGLVNWGIDLPLLVDSTETTHSTGIADAAINSGVLQVERKHIYTKQYIAENEDQKDRALIIEHPIRRGWQLIEPAQPLETTESVYRFRENLPSATKSRLLVKEQIIESEGIDLALADLDTVLAFSRMADVPEPVRTALTKVVTVKQALADQQRQADRRQEQINELTAEQARIRKNIEAAPEDNELRSRWLKKIEETETGIQKLRQENLISAEKREAAASEAVAAIRQITVTRPTRQAAATGK